MSAISESGRQATLALLQEGEVFGELEVLDGTGRAHEASAFVDSTVFALPRSLFLELMRRHSAFAYKVGVRFGRRIQQFQSKIACLLFKGAQSRLSELLLEFAEHYGQPTPDGIRLRYRFSHRDLASLIGVARETVSRWEHGATPIGKIADRLLRLLVATQTPVQDYSADLLAHIGDERNTPSLRLGLRIEHEHWCEAALIGTR